MKALELRSIVLGYEYFQSVSFDIQSSFITHCGIKCRLLALDDALCKIFSLNIPDVIEEYTET